jgi:hypothetical protein
MIGTIGKFKEVSIVCLALAVLAPGFAAGQQGKGGSSTDELLKSIGLAKPAFARAPDFNLRDGAGGLASLSGQSRQFNTAQFLGDLVRTMQGRDAVNGAIEPVIRRSRIHYTGD